MNPIVAEALKGEESEYNALPRCVQDVMTPKEYLWLSDAEKVTLLESMTEPEI